jgi:nucleoside-diphosphate-sugar epimerase
MTDPLVPATPDAASSVPHRAVVLGAGPVGRAITARLVAAGTPPTVITRSGTTLPGAAARPGDVTDTEVLGGLLAGAEVVYHCAQPAYHRWPQEFPALQQSIVEAAGRAGALLVVVENLYGYGPSTAPLHEDLPLDATTRKGAVRARMHLDLLEAHRAGRVRMVVARAADFLGPGVDGSSYGARFVGQVRSGGKVDVLGDPDALHTVTFVPDLAAAMVELAHRPESWGRAWHAPNAPAVSQRELVRLAGQVAGTNPTVRPVKRWQLRALGLVSAPMRETVEMAYEFEHDFVVDDAAFTARFTTRATPLREALTATLLADTRAEVAA